MRIILNGMHDLNAPPPMTNLLEDKHNLRISNAKTYSGDALNHSSFPSYCALEFAAA